MGGFVLKMANGVKVRTLEDLRENFDQKTVMVYFAEGKLLEWLEASYYVEAEPISKVDKYDPDAAKKICEILGVKYEDEGSDVVGAVAITEKINKLKKMTNDEKIIENAEYTAFDQVDLADLLDNGVKTIYLCGDVFSVPVKRLSNVRFVGILDSEPKIKLSSDCTPEMLLDRNIKFESVLLPQAFRQDVSSVSSEAKGDNVNAKRSTSKNTLDIALLKTLLKTHFPQQYSYGDEEEGRWYSVEMGYGSRNHWTGFNRREVTSDVKTICLNLVCQGKYVDDDILHMHMDRKLKFGWALTKDSFCIGGPIGKAIIPYEKITNVSIENYYDLWITTTDEKTIHFDGNGTVIFDGFNNRLVDFLLAVRDLLGTPGQEEQHKSGILNEMLKATDRSPIYWS